MALIQCKECSKEYSDQAATCVNCGAKNPNYRKPMGCFAITALIVGGLVVVFFGFGFILMQSPGGQERSKERDAIYYCEDNYAKLKEAPGTSTAMLQIAYGACEKMKNDFRTKWNREP